VVHDRAARFTTRTSIFFWRRFPGLSTHGTVAAQKIMRRAEVALLMTEEKVDFLGALVVSMKTITQLVVCIRSCLMTYRHL
jgi:hypothetical protein